MEAKAFCPAHITGFFKAYIAGSGEGGSKIYAPHEMGSVGAGFSIKRGVTTTVRTRAGREEDDDGGRGFRISATGFEPDKTDVSEAVLDGFLRRLGGQADRLFFEIEHEFAVPVGYGLGSSGAAALSLSFALDQALGTGLPREELGRIAHNAEISCKTGLGDVLASYHGGFEVRTKPGAPGVGDVRKIRTGFVQEGEDGERQQQQRRQPSAVMICFAPISTQEFVREKMGQLNGLGGKMVDALLESESYDHFQEMSLEFARYAGVMTPRMRGLTDELRRNGIGCGVALFGETVFSMVPKEDEDKVAKIAAGYPGGTVIRSELDHAGARVVQAATTDADGRTGAV